jgi:ankyrin repeat protein
MKGDVKKKHCPLRNRGNGSKLAQCRTTPPVRTLPQVAMDFESQFRDRRHFMFLNASQVFDIYRSDPEYADYDDLTLASTVGDYERVDRCIKAGMNLEGGPNIHTTPLIKSLAARHLKIAELLINRGANVVVASESGRTPLHFVASFGSERLAVEILHRGGKINAQTHDGLTPLLLAARCGRPSVVKLLLDNGADISAADNTGRTVLIYAATGNIDEMLGGNFRSVEILLSKGARVDTQGNDGWTALMGASFFGDVPSVRLLLENHANLNIRENQGRTALGLAIYRKNYDVVEILRTAGALE